MSRSRARTVHNRGAAAESDSRTSLKRLTQDERRERSESRMLAAAIDLFARQGSGRTTLVEIGKVAGYTHGLVGHRFGSKSGLVRRLIKNLQRDFTRRQITEAAEQAALLLAVLRGIEMQWSQEPSAIPLDATIDEIISSLRRSLQPPSAR
jgi:AcrR family transcriptional regulator